ncbi:amidase family protein [Robiginitalea biformata]|nr:amidase family protein [Robiginitalea biformata]
MEKPASIRRRIVFVLGISSLMACAALQFSCKDGNTSADRAREDVPERIWEPYDDASEVAANADHPNRRMRYKLIQSRVTDKNDIFRPLYAEALSLDPARYRELRGLILGRSIPEIQEQILGGTLTYEELTRFFLYRIYTYELPHATTLNTVLAINPNALEEARKKDEVLRLVPDAERHPVFGMPVLLKDNIDTESMPTTAGAVALQENRTEDAFIVNQLQMNGAVILGKVNLSEWAYYFCDGCPVGYSALGGQTLNPYGRRQFETGGSSSGSGTAVAAGYAMGAVGTETSGSILSPSGQNSVVGLKPTVSLLSRTGIVPISSTLDTPGPMARTVTDAAILLDAMRGYDSEDPVALETPTLINGHRVEPVALAGRRFGIFEAISESDSLYRRAIRVLREAGAEIIPITPPETDLDGFSKLLNGDMRKDLPAYLQKRVRNRDAVRISDVADLVAFNREDSLVRAPYGQGRLEGILGDTTGPEDLEALKARLLAAGMDYFTVPWNAHQLDAVLSVNNRHAAYAALGRHPALCVPMGYRESGEPAGLTFIARPFQEKQLLELGRAFEMRLPVRRMPEGYAD